MFRIHNKNITAFIARLSIDRIIVIKQKKSLPPYTLPLCMYVCIYVCIHISAFLPRVVYLKINVLYTSTQ